MATEQAVSVEALARRLVAIDREIGRRVRVSQRRRCFCHLVNHEVKLTEYEVTDWRIPRLRQAAELISRRAWKKIVRLHDAKGTLEVTLIKPLTGLEKQSVCDAWSIAGDGMGVEFELQEAVA